MLISFVKKAKKEGKEARKSDQMYHNGLKIEVARGISK
jgi:hypothetical protein